MNQNVLYILQFIRNFSTDKRSSSYIFKNFNNKIDEILPLSNQTYGACTAELRLGEDKGTQNEI